MWRHATNYKAQRAKRNVVKWEEACTIELRLYTIYTQKHAPVNSQVTLEIPIFTLTVIFLTAVWPEILVLLDGDRNRADQGSHNNTIGTFDSTPSRSPTVCIYGHRARSHCQSFHNSLRCTCWLGQLPGMAWAGVHQD